LLTGQIPKKSILKMAGAATVIYDLAGRTEEPIVRQAD
jgi:hypothetical protein